MKICMIALGWLPAHKNFGAGGIEVHAQHLVAGLVSRGHEVTIITTKHPEGTKKEKRDNLSISYVGDSPLRCTESFYQESVKLFEKLNREERFDIVHTQDYAGFGYLKNCNKVPSVVTSHGTPINTIKSILNVGYYKSFIKIPFWIKCHFFIEPLILRKSNKIIAVSNELAKDIITQYKIPEEKVVVIPNGVDVEKIKLKDSFWLKQKLGIKEGKVLLFVGNISKRKGVDILLKALKQALDYRGDIKLIIVGRGPYMDKLKKLTGKLKITQNVVFAGRVSDGDLPYYYNISYVVVVPSTGAEGLPVVVIEAMASGKPVIASKVGGIPTAIEHLKNGILVKPRDPRELSERILELLNNEEMAKNLGRAGRKKAVERFSLNSMVDSTIKVYESILQES